MTNSIKKLRCLSLSNVAYNFIKYSNYNSFNNYCSSIICLNLLVSSIVYFGICIKAYNFPLNKCLTK